MAAEPKPTVFDVVHEVFDADTTHSLARKAVDAVLDLHHPFGDKGRFQRCAHCSKSRPLFGAEYPCASVKVILKATGVAQ